MENRKWNQKQMNEQLKICQKQQNNQLYSIGADCLKHILDNHGSAIQNSASYTEEIHNTITSLQAFKDFIPSLEEYNRQCKRLKRQPNFYEYFNLPNNIALDFTHDTFAKIHPEFEKVFNKIYAHKKNNLQISSQPSYAFFVPGVNYSYINIQNNNNIEGLLSFVHEYAHAITDYLKNNLGYFNNIHNIEVTSLFCELVAIDNIISYFSGLDDEVKVYLYGMFTLIANFNRSILFADKYYSYIAGIKDYEQAINILANVSQKKPEAVKGIINGSVFKHLPYSYAMLTALELYNLFNKDPDKWYYVWNNILANLKEEETKDTLEGNGLCLNQTKLSSFFQK